MKRIITALLCCIPFFSYSSDLIEKGRQALLNDPALNTSSYELGLEEYYHLWRVWPLELQHKVKEADFKRSVINRLAMWRYGFHPREENFSALPLGLIVRKLGPGKKDKLVFSCLLCHAGVVPGQKGTVLGAPNRSLNLATLVRDRLELDKKWRKYSEMQMAERLLLPLINKEIKDHPVNISRGTSNVWHSAGVYAAGRKKNMAVRKFPRFKGLFDFEDMDNENAYVDPPPWWTMYKKKRLWIDGFAPKTPKALSVVVLPASNDIFAVQKGLTQVMAYMNSLRPAQYPFELDQVLLEKGKKVFQRHCSGCHGSYGEDAHYPSRRIPIESVGTDALRLARGVSREYRQWVANSWIGDYGKGDFDIKPKGYMAPPLDGVWATAPYFHNGSVPTLYHVLFPEERPAIWRPLPGRENFDEEKVGLEFEELHYASALNPSDSSVFNSYMPGRSKDGHMYVTGPTREERLALLEYLKSL